MRMWSCLTPFSRNVVSMCWIRPSCETLVIPTDRRIFAYLSVTLGRNRGEPSGSHALLPPHVDSDILDDMLSLCEIDCNAGGNDFSCPLPTPLCCGVKTCGTNGTTPAPPKPSMGVCYPQ